MMKMWVSFAGIGFLVFAVVLITVSRSFFKGWIARIIAFIAYIFLFLGGLIILFIVFTPPQG